MTDNYQNTSIDETNLNYSELNLKHPLKCLLSCLKEFQKKAKHPLFEITDKGNLVINLHGVQTKFPRGLEAGKKNYFNDHFEEFLKFADSERVSVYPERQFIQREIGQHILEMDKIIKESLAQELHDKQDQISMINSVDLLRCIDNKEKNLPKSTKAQLAITDWSKKSLSRTSANNPPLFRSHLDVMKYDVNKEEIMDKLIKHIKPKFIDENRDIFDEEDELEEEFNHFCHSAKDNIRNNDSTENLYLEYVTENIITKIKRTYSLHYLRKIADIVSELNISDLASKKDISKDEINHFLHYAYIVDYLNEFVQGSMNVEINKQIYDIFSMNYTFKISEHFPGEYVEINLYKIFSSASSFNCLPFMLSFFTSVDEQSIDYRNIKSKNIHFNYKIKSNGPVPDSGCSSIVEYRMKEVRDNIDYIKSNRTDINEVKKSCENTIRILFIYIILFYDQQWDANTKGLKDVAKDRLSRMINILHHSAKQREKNNSYIHDFFQAMLQNTGFNKRIHYGKDKQEVLEFELSKIDPIKKAILYFSGFQFAHHIDKMSPVKLYVALKNNFIVDEGVNDLRIIKDVDYKTEYIQSIVVTAKDISTDPRIFYQKEIVITPGQCYTDITRKIENKEINKNYEQYVLPFEFIPSDKINYGDQHIHSKFSDKLLCNNKKNKHNFFVLVYYNRLYLNMLDVSYNDIKSISRLKYEKIMAVNRLLLAILADRCVKAVVDYFTSSKIPNMHLDFIFGFNHYTSSKSNLNKPEKSVSEIYNKEIILSDKFCIDFAKVDTFVHDLFKNIAFLNSKKIPFKTQGIVHHNAKPALIRGDQQWTKPPKYEWRYANTKESLISMLGTSMSIDSIGDIDKVAIIILSSRPADKIRHTIRPDEKHVLYGETQKFWATKDEKSNLWLNTMWPTSFSRITNGNELYKQADVIQEETRKLVNEGYHDIIIVGKIPFTYKIGMSTDQDFTFTNPTLMRTLLNNFSDYEKEVRIYPFITQKSWGKRLQKEKPKQSIFIYQNGNSKLDLDSVINGVSIERFCSVITGRVVERKNVDFKNSKNYCGSCDYFLVNHFKEDGSINAGSIHVLKSSQKKKDRSIIYESFKLLHLSRFEKSENVTSMKLYPLESIVGDNNLGKKMEIPVTHKRPKDVFINYHAILDKIDQVVQNRDIEQESSKEK